MNEGQLHVQLEQASTQYIWLIILKIAQCPAYTSKSGVVGVG
jgi:hypothetical protein